MADNGRQKGDAALLVALASGQTVRDAAQAADISERTAHRRLEDAAFRRRVADVRADMVARSVGMLADASSEAVATLKGLLRAESESVKLGAARSVLEIGTKLRESVELTAEVAELKRIVEEFQERERQQRGFANQY